MEAWTLPTWSQAPTIPTTVPKQEFSKCLLCTLAENMTTTGISQEACKTLCIWEDLRLTFVFHPWQWWWTCLYEQRFCASVSGWTEPVTVSKREPRSPGNNLPKARGKLVAEPGCRSFLSLPLRQPSVFWKNEWLSRTCFSRPHQELGVNNTRRETKIKIKVHAPKMQGGIVEPPL